MDLTNGKVKLQPLSDTDPSEQVSTVVQVAWGELLYRSVEVISSSLAGVEDFEEECIYLGVIFAKTLGEDLDSAEDRQTYEQWLDHSAILVFRPVGIIYLKASSIPGSLDIGLAIVPEHRGQRWGSEAIRLLMRWAFEELHCHRIQARVVESNMHWRNVAMSAFMSLGLSMEGTSRRAIFCPTHPLDPYPDGTNGEWRDVTHLALLDVDWVMYSVKYDSPSSLLKCRWEELFAREERERSELIRFEEHEERRRRTKRRRTLDGETPGTPLATSNTTSQSSPPYYPPPYAPYPPYPFNTNGSPLDKGKGVDRSMVFSESIDEALAQVRSHTPIPSQPEPALQWRQRTPLRCQTPCSPKSSPSISPARSDSLPPLRPPSESRDVVLDNPFVAGFFVASPVSPTGTSLTFMTDSDDALYDTESVPRSASVISDVSTHGHLSDDQWELFDDASIDSDAAEDLSEVELEL